MLVPPRASLRLPTARALAPRVGVQARSAPGHSAPRSAGRRAGAALVAAAGLWHRGRRRGVLQAAGPGPVEEGAGTVAEAEFPQDFLGEKAELPQDFLIRDPAQLPQHWTGKEQRRYRWKPIYGSHWLLCKKYGKALGKRRLLPEEILYPWKVPNVKYPLIGPRPKARYLWMVPMSISPEMVFVGRSNAGKSTLLNNLMKYYGQAQEAHASWRAGRTRALHWYPLDFPHLVGWTKPGVPVVPTNAKTTKQGVCAVDCFGMGYIEYNKVKSKRLASWGPLLMQFIGHRKSVVTVFHLVSAAAPKKLSVGDRQLGDIFKQAKRMRVVSGMEKFKYILVVTKTDLRTEEELELVTKRIMDDLAQGKGIIPDKIVYTTDAFPNQEGIRDMIDTVSEEAKRGWDIQKTWQREASKKMAKVPRPVGYAERMRLKEARMVSRLRKNGLVKRGGRYGVTSMPPRV